MTAKIELTKAVQLVLLAMFQAIEESVAECDLAGDPGVGVGIAGSPAADQVEVTVVAGELEEGVEALAGDVGGSEIDGVVALANVEGAAVNGDAIDGQRNESVGIGVSVAMSVGGKIVGVEKVSDLEILRDGLAVIARDAGSKILRGLDSSRGGFDGQPRDGDGSAGASGIGVEDLVMNDDALRRIGRQRRRL